MPHPVGLSGGSGTTVKRTDDGQTESVGTLVKKLEADRTGKPQTQIFAQLFELGATKDQLPVTWKEQYVSFCQRKQVELDRARTADNLNQLNREAGQIGAQSAEHGLLLGAQATAWVEQRDAQGVAESGRKNGLPVVTESAGLRAAGHALRLEALDRRVTKEISEPAQRKAAAFEVRIDEKRTYARDWIEQVKAKPHAPPPPIVVELAAPDPIGAALENAKVWTAVAREALGRDDIELASYANRMARGFNQLTEKLLDEGFKDLHNSIAQMTTFVRDELAAQLRLGTRLDADRERFHAEEMAKHTPLAIETERIQMKMYAKAAYDLDGR